MSTKIVATGAGIVTSLGAGVDDFEKALYNGQSGIRPKTLFPESDPGGLAGEITNFTPQTWLGAKGLRVLDRSARLICVAAHMALEASGLSQANAIEGDPDLGLVCGTMFGSVHSITAFDWSGLCDGPNLVNPMEFPNTVLNSPAGQAAIKHKLRGVNSTISAGIVSGLYAMGYAMEFLRFGRAQALLAGGVEELCEESYLSFKKAGLNSTRGRMLPFSPDRDGTILGEASAVWMLETETRALQREARPLLELCGFGSAHDAYSIDRYNPRGEGATAAMHEAMKAAGIEANQVACIVSSANGSRTGDAMELNALKSVFGSRLKTVPVCAPKAAFGEALGVSGALLALIAGIALRRGELPPTTGFQSCEDGLSLSARSQPFAGEYALVNCFGCDGNNAALILKRR